MFHNLLRLVLAGWAIALASGPGLPDAHAMGRSNGKLFELCPTFALTRKIDLTDTEKRLVCGSPPGDVEQSDAWTRIPYAQAQYNLKNFLQDRGYHRAVFKRDEPVKGKNTVEIGEPTRVTSLVSDGAPESLHLERRRKVIGEPLTPKLLGDVEKWSFEQLQANGYACPTIKTTGDPGTGAIVVSVEAGLAQELERLIEVPVSGLEPGVVRRHDAALIGRPFNGNWMELSNRRMVSEDVVESAHFVYGCEAEGVVAKQQVVAGLPRLLLFGVGINTEGVLLAKASWKNARLGKMGSSSLVTVLASSKLQKIETSVHWYLLDQPSRYYLRPLVELKHQNEEFFESMSSQFEVAPAGTWDNQELHADFSLGPNFEAIRTLRGTGSRDTHFLSLGGQAHLKSHDFEFYQNSPRTGFQLSSQLYVNDEAILSDADAERAELRGAFLWNLKDLDPPLLVLGIRGGVGTILTADRPGTGNRLPASFMQFLGGSSDLRGFARKRLPGPDGALTFAFLDFEARVGSVLPWGFDPFIFLDLGETGATPLGLGSPLYWSPGFGLRWQSPIGVLRTTLARGYPENPLGGRAEDAPGGLHFYLSFGEEF